MNRPCKSTGGLIVFNQNHRKSNKKTNFFCLSYETYPLHSGGIDSKPSSQGTSGVVRVVKVTNFLKKIKQIPSNDLTIQMTISKPGHDYEKLIGSLIL